MRLLDLEYPIAIIERDLMMGGKNAGLGSKRRWRNSLASYFLGGGYHSAEIVDARGRRFSVQKILLLPRNNLDRFLGIFTTTGPSSEITNVDMELRLVRQYALSEFCDEMRKLALSRPEWWKRHSSEDEIREMFKGCTTFAEAIDDIGILDAPNSTRRPEKSVEGVDMR